jgi:hypothetical protein
MFISSCVSASSFSLECCVPQLLTYFPQYIQRIRMVISSVVISGCHMQLSLLAEVQVYFHMYFWPESGSVFPN